MGLIFRLSNCGVRMNMIDSECRKVQMSRTIMRLNYPYNPVPDTVQAGKEVKGQIQRNVFSLA